MRPTPLTLTIMGGIAALVVSGCSSSQSGTPSPSTTTATTSSAPASTNPLNTTNFQKNLCGGLTPAQLAPYMGTVSDHSTRNAPKSSACNLDPGDTHMASISISIFPNLTASDMYASGRNFPYSKNLDPVQGYPAQDASQGNPPSGECSTSVAVSDHVVVTVEALSSTGFQYYNNMCQVSEALAPMLISNIKSSG